MLFDVGQNNLTSMTTTSSWLLIVICGLVSAKSSLRGEESTSPLPLLPPLVTSSLRGQEVILHTGPPVSTPSSTPVTPVPERGSPKLINFQREFFIDRDQLASLPKPSSEFGTVPVSAVEAIKLATKDIDPRGELRTLIVTDVRLLKGPADVVQQIEYYLISTLGNGSEVHRIVLMNRLVLSPKLRQIKE